MLARRTDKERLERSVTCLGPGEADPPDSLFATGDEAEAGLAPKKRNRLDGELFDESRLHGVTTQTEERDRAFQ